MAKSHNQVFCSYAHADKSRVERLVAALNDAGIKAWYDTNMNAGDQLSEKLAQEICDSACFVVFVSHNSLESRWVQMEVSTAFYAKVPSVVVYLDDVAYPLPAFFQMKLSEALHVAINDISQPHDERMLVAALQFMIALVEAHAIGKLDRMPGMHDVPARLLASHRIHPYRAAMSQLFYGTLYAVGGLFALFGVFMLGTIVIGEGLPGYPNRSHYVGAMAFFAIAAYFFVSAAARHMCGVRGLFGAIYVFIAILVYARREIDIKDIGTNLLLIVVGLLHLRPWLRQVRERIS